MTGKKNISQPDMDRRKEWLEDFEYLNEFSKIDFNQISEREIDKVCHSHTIKVLLEQSARPFSDFMKYFGRYDEIRSEAGYEGLREYLKKLQGSLLGKITEIKNALLGDDNRELLSFTGKVHIVLNPNTKKYDTKFLPVDFVTGGDIDFKMDCEMLTSRYFEVLSYLLQELPKERFKVCEKDGCGTPFFQATAREKLFCSFRCSKAAAQANYMEKKMKGGINMPK